jgi:hypothetical protein
VAASWIRRKVEGIAAKAGVLRSSARAVAALALCGMLGGCALPPALAVAGYVGDGVLLAATGKSSSDIGMSLATGQDCRAWRLFRQENLCQDEVVAKPEAIPAEVAQDEDQAARQIADMPVDDASRAALAERTLAAAFQPLAAADGYAAPLPRPAEPAVLAKARPAPPIVLLARGGGRPAAGARVRPLPVELASASVPAERVSAKPRPVRHAVQKGQSKHYASRGNSRRLAAAKGKRHLAARARPHRGDVSAIPHQWQGGHSRYQPSVSVNPLLEPAKSAAPAVKPAPKVPHAAAPGAKPARSSSLWPQPVGPPAGARIASGN